MNDDLQKAATYCNLDEESAELVTGGLLTVLQKSQNLEKDTLTKILDSIPNSDKIIANYRSAAFRAALPNPATMLLPRPDFAPPGPPPWVVVGTLAKGIKKVTRTDKDVGNTQEVFQFLVQKKHMDERAVLLYMEAFTVAVKDRCNVDLEDILCLPAVS